MDSYNQQVFHNEEYCREEEQQNVYWEDHGYPTHSYSPNWDDSQCSFEEDSYHQYPQIPQPNDGFSDMKMLAMLQEYQAKVTQDNLNMIQNFQALNQRLDELAAQNRMLESTLAQRAIEDGNLDEEEEVSGEEVTEPNISKQNWDQAKEDEFLRVVTQAYKKAWNGESCTDDELEHKVATPLTTCMFQDHSNEDTHEFIIPSTPWISNEKFFNDDDSCIEEICFSQKEDLPLPATSEIQSVFEEEIKDEQPRGFHVYEDFVEVYMGVTREQPRIQESASIEMGLEDWAPKEVIEKLKDDVPIKLETSFEDPFFTTPPRDKFRSFVPYFAKLLARSSHNPSILKGFILSKRLSLQLEIHCRLDGRKVKWDLKVD